MTLEFILAIFQCHEVYCQRHLAVIFVLNTHRNVMAVIGISGFKIA